ncbi:MAG: efflux RND transporter periplasmic adaptor subunit [Oscillatoriales cyanobacterium]|nr:MAG: efflux RND transporter periplasmic adaptor subunit [Oscillatoriales cyanobacterium]TAH24486.1 MAG: efflux RND transporter periplasmic adaptor subunit [Oscillatoriales cyanobacterium]
MIFHKSAQFTAIISSGYGTLLSLILLTSPTAVFAHAGHGDEFHQSGETTQIPAAISVDAETSKRIGIKVEPVKAQRLAVGIKTTGQIETLPNQKVEVRAPVSGTVVELLVKPGDKVSKGQILAVLSSSELGQLRVESVSKRAEAEGNLQQAQADFKLAQENYDRQLNISAAEIAQAKTQLTAVTQQYEQEQQLVNNRSVVKVAKENYQRQVEISQAEIARAETELTVAKEQFDRDQELVASGAIARRTMLESQAHFAEAKATVAKAKSRPEVVKAETEIKQAEVDLPLRELRDSQGKVAEAKAQLTKALSRREVLETEAQLKRAKSALEVAQSRIRLSSSAYEARLQQLGIAANDKGLVTVVAPIAGIVADREITPGESVNSAEKPLMSILNDSSVFATANIYEKDLNLVKNGQELTVKIASLPNRTFRGKISFIGSIVEGETRAVPVKALLDNSEGILKPGMFAELEILTDKTATNILAIPVSAVVEANGKQLVYVKNGDAFQAMEVALGQTSGDLVEIKSGLFEGDLIVTQRAPQLYAQSLRGGSKPSKTEDKKEVTPKVTEVNSNSFPVPLWAGIGGGIAIASLTFAIGAFWGNRRKLPALAADSKNNTANNGFSTSVQTLNDELLLHNDNHHVKAKEPEIQINNK